MLLLVILQLQCVELFVHSSHVRIVKPWRAPCRLQHQFSVSSETAKAIHVRLNSTSLKEAALDFRGNTQGSSSILHNAIVEVKNRLVPLLMNEKRNDTVRGLLLACTSSFDCQNGGPDFLERVT